MSDPDRPERPCRAPDCDLMMRHTPHNDGICWEHRILRFRRLPDTTPAEAEGQLFL